MSKHSSTLHIPIYGPLLLVGLLIGELKIAVIICLLMWFINLVLWVRADFKQWGTRQGSLGVPIHVKSDSGDRTEYL